MNGLSLGFVPFVDGVSREVILDDDGSQYVLDEAGQPIYGVWIYMEPEFITRETTES